MVETRIANTNSPWLAGVVGDIHAIPVSHGEGNVTAEEFRMWQWSPTQYVDSAAWEGKNQAWF